MAQRSSYYSIIVKVLFLSIFTICFFPGFTQDETNEQEGNSDSTEAEAVIEKAPLRMSFEAFRINGELKLLARVRSKVNSKYQNTSGVEIRFYKGDTSPENQIGTATSNRKGEAIVRLDLSSSADTIVSSDYYAVVSDHPDYEDAEEMLTVNPGIIRMQLVEEDSIRTIEIFVGSIDSAGITPIAEAECKVYVQRLFGLMPLGDPVTTDEEGNAVFEFPGDIKGDTSGTIKIVAKISEHELIGNIQTDKEIAWGVPVVEEDFFSQRQLWSARSNSPVLLIIVVNGIIIGIWAAILFIFYEIYRINKLGKAS